MAKKPQQPQVPQDVAANIRLLRQLHADLQKASGLIDQQKLEAAEKILTQLVNRESNYFGAWFLLGVLAYRKKQWMPAATFFSRAAMLNPQDEPTQLNLGRTYIEIEAYTLAEQTLRGVIARLPDDPDAYRALAKSHYEDKDYLAAIAALEEARLRDPNNVETLHALGSAHGELGNLDQARESYEEALKRAVANKKKASSIPAIVSQLLGLPVAHDLKALRGHVRQQKKLLQARASDSADALQFAEARLLEKEENFETAWQLLLQANKSMWERQGGANGGHATRLENSIHYAGTFTAEDLQDAPKKAKGPVPLFIVGASRSGKTTFERLIGINENVQKGYETKMVEHAITRTALQAGLPKLTDFWYLPENVDAGFASVFGEALADKAQAANVFTITYPGSIHHAGRIARTIPNAKFVFMTRNREDQALRCFQKHYRRGNTYSYNWDTCMEFLARYDELADCWLDKLGPRAMRLTYEDLVANPKSAVQAASALVGAPFATSDLPTTGNDTDCAAPYRPFFSVETA